MMNEVLCKKLGAAAAPFRSLALALVLVLPALITGAHARDLGALGGDGGGEFRAACRANDVIIGFNMRTGAAVDAIVPICIALTPERTEWTGQAYEPTQYWGGPGGAHQKIACQPGDAVRHLHVHVGPWTNDVRVVKHVFMTCQDLASGKWYDVFPERLGADVMNERRFSCGDGEWGSAIYGRYGSLVDKLGFACERIAAATPAPAPAPAAEETVEVDKTVDVYQAPGGDGPVIAVLQAGTPNVKLLERQAPWYHVKWAQGEGWVYSGEGYQSLKFK